MKRLSILLTAALIGAAAAYAKSPDYSRFTTFYGQRATLFDMLPMDSRTIVMLGNSITNGVNRGISGDTVEGIQARLGSIIKAAPAKIFLMIGVNDVSHDLTADSIATSIGELVHRIRTQSPATKLYLQSLLPVNQSFGRFRKLDGKEQVIRDINAMLPAIAEREGATFINLYPLMSDADGNLRTDLTNDGLHLLGPAYLVWRDAIMPYINE